MRIILGLFLIFLLSACDYLIPKSDPALAEEIKTLTGEQEVNVQIVMEHTFVVNVIGEKIFNLDNNERDQLAKKVALHVFDKNKDAESIIVMAIKLGESNLTATYTWEVVDGQLKPVAG